MPRVLIGGLAFAAGVALTALLAAGPAAASSGGGYGGSSGDAIWSLAWWAGNPEGPGPFTGPPSSQQDVCIWRDVGSSVSDFAAALEQSGLPATFWQVPQSGGHPGIWGVLRWSAAEAAHSRPGDHFDLVGCPDSAQVPANGGDVESSFPEARLPDGHPIWLWAFYDRVPDPPAGALPGVVEKAYRRVGLPEPAPRTSPSRVGGITRSTVVNVSTWLWIDPSIWHTYAATAQAGPIVATAWAYPEAVSWQADWNFPAPSEDPEHSTTLAPEHLRLVCDGPGTPYRPAVPLGAQSTGCSAVFAEPTLGTRQPLRATVTWVVHWAVSSTAGVVGGEGLLPPVTSSRAVPLRVMQVESIIERG